MTQATIGFASYDPFLQHPTPDLLRRCHVCSLMANKATGVEVREANSDDGEPQQLSAIIRYRGVRVGFRREPMVHLGFRCGVLPFWTDGLCRRGELNSFDRLTGDLRDEAEILVQMQHRQPT